MVINMGDSFVDASQKERFQRMDEDKAVAVVKSLSAAVSEKRFLIL